MTERGTVREGREIRWRTAGSGSPTIVLEAGLTASASEWTTILPRLAQTSRVIAVSRAGYGGSTPVGRRPARESVADLAAVLDEVQGPLVLVGHSWGGLLARLYAADHPRRVLGLVLLDATHEALEAMRARRATLLGQLGMTAAVLQARLGKTRRDLEAGRGPLGPALSAIPPELRRAVVEELSHVRTWQQARRDHLGIAKLLRELHARPLPAPSVPVVALVGALAPAGKAATRQTVIRTYESWVASLPNGRLVMAPRSGHLVPQDDEDLVVEVVEELVAALRAQPRSASEPHVEAAVLQGGHGGAHLGDA